MVLPSLVVAVMRNICNNIMLRNSNILKFKISSMPPCVISNSISRQPSWVVLGNISRHVIIMLLFQDVLDSSNAASTGTGITHAKPKES